MKGGCLHRLLVKKLCFSLLVLLVVPILVLLLEGASVLTYFSSTPEQLKVFSQGFQQLQEQEHLRHDVSPLHGSSGPSSRSHTQRSRTKLNKGFQQLQEQEHLRHDVSPLHGSSGPSSRSHTQRSFQQLQEQEHLRHDVSPLHGSSSPSSRSHTQRSRTKLNKDCNFAKGKWVADEKRPLYSGNGCKQWLSKMWACRKMKRADFSYESFRWQPHGCEMPEFTGPNFLDRMKHKTLAFIGDSLGRQQFQSMMCIASGGKYSPEVEDVGRKYGLVKARRALRPDGWAYRFPASNTTILFYWSASLSELEPFKTGSSVTSYALHLDRPVTFLKKYVSSFDILVLNTGHHWNRGKFDGNHWKLYADGKPVGKGRLADLNRAKNLTLHSIARWMDSEIVQRPQMKVFLRTISPRHFVNGDWNTGGTCGNTIPMSHGNEVLQDHSSDLLAESAVNGTRVKLLDITAISQLRDEGHISNSTFKASKGIHDCLHWCLPGIPDMWNELLFAQI